MSERARARVHVCVRACVRVFVRACVCASVLTGAGSGVRALAAR